MDTAHQCSTRVNNRTLSWSRLKPRIRFRSATRVRTTLLPIFDRGTVVKKQLFAVAAGALLLLNACSGTAANRSGGTQGFTATHFSVTAQPASTAGTPFNFTVTALDASDNVVTSYAGEVSFSSTDGKALLPTANSTLANGTATFQATLKGAGAQTITGTDRKTAAISGTSESIHVSAAAVATHFRVATPATAASGTAFRFPVTAVDAAGNLISSYAGVVHFTSSDGQAVLPTDESMADGTRTFTATMINLGPQNITATDVSASLTGTSSEINVLPAKSVVSKRDLHHHDRDATNE